MHHINKGNESCPIYQIFRNKLCLNDLLKHKVHAFNWWLIIVSFIVNNWFSAVFCVPHEEKVDHEGNERKMTVSTNKIWVIYYENKCRCSVSGLRYFLEFWSVLLIMMEWPSSKIFPYLLNLETWQIIYYFTPRHCCLRILW